MDETETITILALLVPLVHLTGFVNAGHAVMRARTPQSSVGWAVALISFPYLAIPLYWLFGSFGFKAYAQKLREAEAVCKEQIHHIAEAVRPFTVHLDHDRWGTQPFLHRLTHWPVTGQNDVHLLIDGEETFEAILTAIGRARVYVAVEFYILRHDVLGQRLQEALMERARNGVRVYLLCDAIGSYYLGRQYFHTLQEAGVDCRFFRTSKGWVPARFHLNFRNHRKIVVIDGREAFVGGLNVGDEYLGTNRYFGHWRDTHVAVHGPAVQGVQLAFAKDWYWMTEHLPDFDWDPQAAEGDTCILPLDTGPESAVESCRLTMIHAIHSARERLWIASPYFVPDEGFVQALVAATMRGVDVRILLPQKPDHRLVYLASFSYLEDLVPCGIKIYRYQEGFLHQKVWLVDNWLAIVGTANVDNRAFRLNFEISMLVFDEGFCHEVEAMLEEDFSHSEEQPAHVCQQRGLLFRIAVRACRLMAPVL